MAADKNKKEPRRFYRVPSLAARWDCSKGHIYGLLRTGALTRIKLSEQITVIDAAEVEAYEQRHMVTA